MAIRPRRSIVLVALASPLAMFLLSGCGTSGSLDPAAWTHADVVGYRLLAKRDFQAKSSSRIQGNVAHGAEICTAILPADDYERSGAFRAVMNPECSFWNSTVGPLGTLGGLAGASVLPGIPTQQPDWYVLQHEQIHFAIMEVAARQLSREITSLAPEARTPTAIQREYRAALARTNQNHTRFDAATSGVFDPARLGEWVRALETEMRRQCGTQPHCWVRQRTPMGWGR